MHHNYNVGQHFFVNLTILCNWIYHKKLKKKKKKRKFTLLICNPTTYVRKKLECWQSNNI